jgi:dGTP triphosphohydrolase
LVNAGIDKVNIKAAVKRLEVQLPSDVASLVRTGAEGHSQQPFSEDSLAKARKYLNELVFKAWGELDDKLIECKEYEDRNLQTWEQVKVDIARLAETIADLSRLKAEATEMINAMEQNILATLATLKKETEQYTKVFMVNKHELTIRQNDLAVFSFMLKLVKCKKAAAFVQLDQHPAICETEGGRVFDF